MNYDTAGVSELLERLRDEGRFPPTPKIRRFEVEADHDHTGDPALFIWVLLDDGTPEEEFRWSALRPFEEAIREAVFASDDPRWPYVRFRTEAEHRELTRR